MDNLTNAMMTIAIVLLPKLAVVIMILLYHAAIVVYLLKTLQFLSQFIDMIV